MEVFATFFLILLAGMAVPVVLLISGVLFDLVVVICVLTQTMVSRTRKPGTAGSVGRYSEVREIGWAG
jgi:hypothetical protein